MGCYAQVNEKASMEKNGLKSGETASDSRFGRALPRVTALEGVTKNFLVPIKLGDGKDGEETTLFSVARQQQGENGDIPLFVMFGGKTGGEGLYFGLYLDGARAGQLYKSAVPRAKSATVTLQALYLSFKGRGKAEQSDLGLDPAVVLERSGVWGILRDAGVSIAETFSLAHEDSRSLKITAIIPKERAISVAEGSCEDTPGKDYGNVVILMDPLDSANQPRLHGMEYQVQFLSGCAKKAVPRQNSGRE